MAKNKVKLITGADMNLRVQVLGQDGEPQAIDTSSIVKACLRKDKVKLTPDINCTSVMNEADWANGIIAIPLSSTITKALPPCSVASVEVHVQYMGAVTKWLGRHIQIVKGLINVS